MADAFQTLLKINDMKKQAAEQAQAELSERIRTIETKINQIRVSMEVKAASIDGQSATIHTDILTLEKWQAAQKRHIVVQEKALETLRTQQAILKKDLSKLLVQETSFKQVLSDRRKAKILAQDNLRDEANNAIWVQRQHSRR